MMVLTIGGGGQHWQAPPPFMTHALGRLSDDAALARAYAAADVFVAPALADQLPNTILESMACGTPVVAFAVGGILEAVTHRETGYLAQPKDAADLAHGIELLCTDTALARACAERGRHRMVQDFILALQTQRFLECYKHCSESGSEPRPLSARIAV
jgi:glycosyltransferase involved in cell wall biosynthesis